MHKDCICACQNDIQECQITLIVRYVFIFRYSRTCLGQTSLEPRKIVRDMGTLIMVPGQKANGDDLGICSGFSTQYSGTSMA